MLIGAAGTGKTTLIRELINSFKAQHIAFALMAPTGRAAKILSERVGEAANTIHRTIYQQKDFEIHKDQHGELDTFKLVFSLKSNHDNANTVYIVDEASMVSDVFDEQERFRFGSGFLLSDLMTYVNLKATNNSRRIIFVGDAAQLPPINASNSAALAKDYISEKFQVNVCVYELSRIHRQAADSGILYNAIKIRHGIEKKNFTAFSLSPKPDVCDLMPRNFVPKYGLLSQQRPNDELLVIVHSNEQVNDYNKMIRNLLFGDQPDPIVGDTLLVVQNNYNLKIPLFNGDFVKVEHVSEKTVKQSARMKGKSGHEQIDLIFREARIRLIGEQQTQTVLLVENLLDSTEPNLSPRQQDALFVNFKMRNPQLKPGSEEFKIAYAKDPFVNALRVKYGYAVTCHKAQGGEWETIIVDFDYKGSKISEEFFRWSYTAVTRARKKLFFINATSRTALTLRNPITIDIKNGLVESIEVCKAGKDSGVSLVELAVRQVVLPAGFEIQSVRAHQYQNSYKVIKTDETYRLEVVYNSKQSVTRTKVIPTDLTYSHELETLVASLKDKRIIDVGQTASIKASCPDNLTEQQRNFDASIQQAANFEQITAAEIIKRDDYSLRYIFWRQGHETVIDYSLDKAGVLTHVAPLAKRTTQAKLLRDVLALTNGVRYD